MRVFARHPWTTIGVAVVAALLAGTYAVWALRDDASGSVPGWLDSLESVQGEWVSQVGFAYDGTEPWIGPVRLTISGDELRWYAGCNHLSAEVTIEDHRLSGVGSVTSTEIGCPAELRARDAWLTALMDDHATVQVKGSTDGPMLALDSDAGWIGFVRPR